MDSIRAVMPRTVAKGQDNGEDLANANLEALREFVKSMQSKTMSRLWRGRRTGLMIDDSHVAKGADGMDNIDSFWDNAQIEADTASTPGGSSSQGVSTPSSVASPAANSPGTAESASWVGVGALEAAGGDDSEGTDNEAAAEEGESRMPAKRLEYRLPPKSLMAARSEASTDEELMAEGTARVGKEAGGKPGDEKANRNRSDRFGDEDDDDDTETDGDQQHQEHHQEQQEHQQRQEEHHRQQQQQQQEQDEHHRQQQQQQEQEQRQLQQQQQQNAQLNKEQETQQQQQQQNTQQNKQQQTQQQQQQQKQQQKPQEPGGTSGSTTPADAADAAAGGKGGESTPKGNHGSARSVRDRGGSARGRGKGRGAASPAATPVAGTAATQAAGKATETPARMSTGGVKDDGIASEAVGTRSGGRGWRKQVQHDSSSDDDDDDDGGGGGGGPWSFDDMEQDEGRDAEVSAERAPRPKSVSPRSGVKGSTLTQSPRSSSRSSPRTKLPSPRTKLPSPRSGSVGVASASSTHRKSVDGDGSPPFPSPRRSRGRGGDSGSPPGSGSTKRSSGGSNRKGRPTKHKPASPSPSTVKRKGKGKGMGGGGDREEEDDEKEEEEEEGSAAGGGGGAGDDDERRDVFDYDGGVDDQNGGVGESSGGDIGGVEGVENEGGSPSPLTRGASKAKGRAQSRNAEETGESKEGEANKRKRKDNGRLSEGAGAKKSGGRGKRGGALHSLRSPRSGGPRFVAIPEVSERSHTPGTRRSGRHRVAPIKFWKGDNIQYGVDEQGLPVAEGIVRGMGPSTPGPSKKRLRGEGGQRGRKRARASKPMTPMKATQLAALPKGKYLEKEEECVVWDEETATNMRRHVVMRATNLVNHTLAATLDRPPGKEKVGAAAQAFNVPGEVGISEWLSGRLVVPEGAIKDSEHVAYSTQIYVVAEGQPNALELAIAMPNKKLKSQSNIFDPKTAQRFLLSPGDHFFVPVNNIYRLENHSENTQAVIYWTILKSSGS